MIANGTILNNRYEIQNYHDAGGMQYVYLAKDLVLNRIVALKTPKSSSAEKRFKRSAIVSARVNHPNVAKTLDYFEFNGSSYLIEEFIDGQNLQVAVFSNQEHLDPFSTAKVFHHLAKGLAASHHAGVIHRDLKPSNIMVGDPLQLESLKITDFGIAKLAEGEFIDFDEGDETTHSSTVMGALPYMSYELINESEDVDCKTDIWSLGAIAFELLTGDKPFGSGFKVMRNLLEGKQVSLPEFSKANPQFNTLTLELFNIIQLCFMRDISERPSADQLVEMCGDLMYLKSERYVGIFSKHNRERKNQGFISAGFGNDVFVHFDSVYGVKPKVGQKVVFSKSPGGGSDRAHPVVCMI